MGTEQSTRSQDSMRKVARTSLAVPLALAAVAILGVSLWLGGDTRAYEPAAPRSAVTEEGGGEIVTEPSGPMGRRPAAETVTSPAAPSGGPPIATFPAERALAALEIEVVDADGVGAPRATVSLRSHSGPRPGIYPFSDGRDVERQLEVDDDGRARLEDLPTGPYEALASTADDGSSGRIFLLETPQTRVRLVLDEVTVHQFAPRLPPLAYSRGSKIELGHGDFALPEPFGD